MQCKNIGTIDRTVRVIAGISAIVIALTALDLGAGNPAGVVAAAVGAVLILTASLGVCPAYIPFKFTTCRVDTER